MTSTLRAEPHYNLRYPTKAPFYETGGLRMTFTDFKEEKSKSGNRLPVLSFRNLLQTEGNLGIFQKVI